MPANSALNEIYANAPLAVAFAVCNDESQWRINWQNQTAHSLWGHYDLNLDVELKLQLLSAMQRTSVTSFRYALKGLVEACQFTLVHYQDGILIQFVMAGAHTENFNQQGPEDQIYRTVSDAAGLGLFDWDLKQDLIRYSDRFYQMCDISPVELGQTKAEIMARVHPQDLVRIDDALFAHLEARWPFNVMFRFKTSSNSYIWMQLTGQAIWQADSNQAYRLVGSVRDVSDAKRLEQTVRQREVLIEQILDALPISIYVKDAQGCFRFYSKQTEQITGVERNRAIGRTDFEVFPIELARKFVDDDRQAKQSAELIVSEEPLTLMGQTRWLLTGRGPIHIQRPDQPPEIWILGFALDITERKEMEQVLEQARQEAESAANAKSEFLSVMSHEIRTPLNAVIGMSNLLLDQALSTEQKNQAEMIQRSGQHLLHLVNDILDFNKLDAGRVELESHAFDLNQQIDNVIEMLKPSAQAKGIELKLEKAPGLVAYVKGDQARLRQVLLNLLGNAIKFTEQGSVTLKVMGIGHRARFEVKDTGIGIAEEKLAHLFDAFTQADASISRKYGGTGLGLSISKKLAQAMQGDIGARSRLGVGSCFWFEVPCVPATPEEVELEGERINYQNQRALSILVAEDNPSNQLLIKAILAKLKHQVTLAENGVEVLEQLNKSDTKFDLILMDMQMPKMDGLEATRRIRGHGNQRLACTPIIALTANAMFGDREKVMAAGMNDYLSKPIDVEALKKALWCWSQ
ncbi:MAG: response regulator [Thiomicrospira sp.]|uniref:PAS domain-containing hybrid sensor histidine kinase/response regulator n=1 Tax=Thiomicrospira sp. TaxID=935 RepID=UPI001A06F8A9|nr:PAS domain-containing hybrid sensor histidine kinase/response regulator [Thiomicrospira sp.]MBE0493562.1 response regulator [Thiomicrospira sp.]